MLYQLGQCCLFYRYGSWYWSMYSNTRELINPFIKWNQKSVAHTWILPCQSQCVCVCVCVFARDLQSKMSIILRSRRNPSTYQTKLDNTWSLPRSVYFCTNMRQTSKKKTHLTSNKYMSMLSERKRSEDSTTRTDEQCWLRPNRSKHGLDKTTSLRNGLRKQ